MGIGNLFGAPYPGGSGINGFDNGDPYGGYEDGADNFGSDEFGSGLGNTLGSYSQLADNTQQAALEDAQLSSAANIAAGHYSTEASAQQTLAAARQTALSQFQQLAQNGLAAAEKIAGKFDAMTAQAG